MDQDSLAARRFWIMQLLRICGLGLTLFGVAILAGSVDQSPTVGAALLVIGVIDFFVVPNLLARRWKSGE